MCGAGHLKSSGPGDDALVDHHIVDAPQAVANSVRDLRDGMLIGPFDQQRDRLRVLDFFLRNVSLCSRSLRTSVETCGVQTMKVYFSSPS